MSQENTVQPVMRANVGAVQREPRISATLHTLQRLITHRNRMIEVGKPCPVVRFRIAWNMRRLRALEAANG